ERRLHQVVVLGLVRLPVRPRIVGLEAGIEVERAVRPATERHCARPQLLRARLGATRGGSPGIFGYTGGHGASVLPFASPRSYISSSGSIDCGCPGIASHGSPSASTRAGTVAIVRASASIFSSSSHVNGVDTWAPTRARTHHAPNTVLCGEFWLKSTKM